MFKRDFLQIVERIHEEDPRYSKDVYLFVREGLDYTLKSLRRKGAPGRTRVTGQELLGGLRDYALREFGPMSKTVLNEWGVENCEDLGRVVFHLVRYGVLGKTEADSLEDFRQGFSFEEAFVKPFQPRRDSRTVKKGKKSPGARSKKGKMGAQKNSQASSEPAP
ncbi:Minf_1886 family protein [Candidatus Methylacidithermus pantelleriae]|uniref:Verruc_Plancto-restricted protein n=1 Tax=Candidatus Methylacidithermus pantelleriae TaxID=2744239 RepID=A0A8J2BJR9_9BACT|nr:Minf_1886 family protein [Candidatus Methylacidithermus pantelleriae]CAF0693591.1 Verruc_Plancto-restricted protein [Candidatus Methylacidithermus pantelleriae]